MYCFRLLEVKEKGEQLSSAGKVYRQAAASEERDKSRYKKTKLSEGGVLLCSSS